MQKAKLQNQNLPKGWRTVELGEVVENFDSKRIPLSSMERAKIQGKYPYYGAAEIVDYINKYIFDGLYILIAEDGTVIANGNKPMLQLVDGKFWVNNHTHVIRGKNDLETKYLFYALKNTSIVPYITGAVQLKLTQANLNKIKIPYPDNSKTRTKIASILSAFDDKIELNNKINKTLEEMAQAIFKEWFIKNQKAKIKKQKLGDLVNITYGKGPASNELKKSGYPVYGANGIIGYCDSYSCSDRQIIIGCRGVVGNITLTLPKCTITHNSLVLTPLNNRKIFLYYLLKNQKLDAIAGGSAQPQITIRDLENFELAIPDEKIQDKFESIVNIIEQKRLNNFYENQKLAELRDLLLPKLMNGEIRV